MNEYQIEWACSYCQTGVNLNDDGVTFTKRYRSTECGRIDVTRIACEECDHE